MAGDETRQRILIFNYSQTFSMENIKWELFLGNFFIWCHPPCSLTAADKICHIFPRCSPLPALFLSSSFLLHLDIGMSCGRGPQLLLALVTGAVLGLCWDGPTRTWHFCAHLADPPLNKRGIFLPKVFTA